MLTRAGTAAGQTRRQPGLAPRLLHSGSVQIAGLKNAHTGRGVVIRLYESAGRTVETILAGLSQKAKVWETNLVEDNQHELPVQDGGVRLTFRPWQVRTLRVG